MRPLGHIVAGLSLGAMIYRVTASWQLTTGFVMAEVFWDIDHLLEHCVQSPHPFCMRTFFSRYNSLDWPKIRFVLHSYEFIVLLALLGWYYDYQFILAIALGGFVHIVLDEIGNRLPWAPARIVPWFYFFSYRLFRRFRTDALLISKMDTRLDI